jgi:fermentation-respiration switch protein FrsA (DUF1100 family)
MAVKFKCPTCQKSRSPKEITMHGTGEWGCPNQHCRPHPQPRNAWFNNTANPGVPADTYFYRGPGKVETFGAGLIRAIARPAAFAANFDMTAAFGVAPGDRMANIRSQQTLDPAARGQYQEVTIYLVQDEITLKGRFFTPAAVLRNKTVILMSGSGGVASEQFAKTVPKYLRRVGVSILMMDYRGFGRSAGTASSRGLYCDAEAMLAYLTASTALKGRGLPGTDVVVHGYSLGSGPAVELARQHSPPAVPAVGGLILQCPMQSSAANAGGGFNSWVAENSFAFDNITKIAAINVPILILNARQDAMNPQGQALQAAATAAGALPPNVTRVEYNGEHLEPENAFRDTDVRRDFAGNLVKTVAGQPGVRMAANPALQAIRTFFANLP